MDEITIKFIRDTGFVKKDTIQTLPTSHARSLIDRGAAEEVLSAVVDSLEEEDNDV